MDKHKKEILHLFSLSSSMSSSSREKILFWKSAKLVKKTIYDLIGKYAPNVVALHGNAKEAGKEHYRREIRKKEEDAEIRRKCGRGEKSDRWLTPVAATDVIHYLPHRQRLIRVIGKIFFLSEDDELFISWWSGASEYQMVFNERCELTIITLTVQLHVNA